MSEDNIAYSLRAMRGMEALAEQWFKDNNLAEFCVAVANDRQKVAALVEQAYLEGVCAGAMGMRAHYKGIDYKP